MTITITNDDGTTQTFVPEVQTPEVEVIAVPLDKEIKIVAR